MKTLFLFACALLSAMAYGQSQRIVPQHGIPTEDIHLSDPFVLADSATHTYYMTGTGGLVWKSSDLKLWSGPYKVTETDPNSWMGPNPMIWAAELHQYKGKYYYFATFTNRDVIIETVKGNAIERRASHILVSDNPMGPYRPMEDETYLPADKPTLDGTFWVDKDGKPYMVYCWEWLQNWNGTIDKIELKPDLSGSIGQGKTLFRASDSPWSRERDEKGKVGPNKVTDGPFLFRTSTGRLGMLWTSWIYDVYTQGVAYSASGTLDGPWLQQPSPITPPNYGHGMLFRTFEGELLLSCHSHAKDAQGRTIRKPHFFHASLEGDRLDVKEEQDDKWQLIWHDEFHGTGALDTTVWTAEHGFVRNEEYQWYQQQNAYRQDGILVLEGRLDSIPNPRYRRGSQHWRENRPVAHYSSASVHTRHSFAFLYGRMEVRARIPAVTGSWPAIWTLGKDAEWPSCGEIDVMEYYQVNAVPHILANAAWGNDRRHSAVWNSRRIPFDHFLQKDPHWGEKFHIWTMDWTPEYIRIRLDGELLNDIDLSQTINGSVGNHTNPFHSPQYILLDLAIGGANGGEPCADAFPMRYEIDYVRVYQKKE